MPHRAPPSQAALVARTHALQALRAKRVGEVRQLTTTQVAMSEELRGELDALKAQGAELDELERDARAGGLVSALVRRLTGGRTALQRRSITQGLVERYELVSGRLQRASAFADELRFCAVELQAEVRDLQAEQRGARADASDIEQRLADAARRLASAGLDAAEADELGFQLRQLRSDLQLHRLTIALADEHLGPAQQLRDLVMSLHSDLAAYVLRASGVLNQAGRRIHALGMAADAPGVVADLQASLDDLQDAMAVTSDYVDSTRDLIARVLPELTAQLEAHAEVQRVDDRYQLPNAQRLSADAAADRALRHAAQAEVDAALKGGAWRPNKQL